jgi:hypothetical protein
MKQLPKSLGKHEIKIHNSNSGYIIRQEILKWLTQKEERLTKLMMNTI